MNLFIKVNGQFTINDIPIADPHRLVRLDEMDKFQYFNVSDEITSPDTILKSRTYRPICKFSSWNIFGEVD